MELTASYKETAISSIPRDWGFGPIGDKIDLLTGFPFSSSEYTDSGLRLLRGSNVKRGETDWSDDITNHWPSVTADINRYKLQSGDLVIAMDGALVGKSYALLKEEDLPALLLQRVARIRSSEIEIDFLAQFFAAQWFAEYSDTVKTHTAIPHISADDIRNFKIPLPPLPEQRAIADALSDVDALIERLDALTAKKRAIKTATMQRLLTGKQRLPSFDGDWNQKMVGDVIDNHFSGPSPTCEDRNISHSEEWGVLKTTATTRQSGWDWSQHKVLPRAYWGRNELELEQGDVIITKAGPRHRVGVASMVDHVPHRIIVSGKMVGLRPNHAQVHPTILAAVLNSPGTQNFLDERTTGMAESQVNFSNQTLLNAPIVIPSMDEQDAIATILSDMDAEIDAVQARRDKTEDIKQGMMQELLTGRTRLV